MPPKTKSQTEKWLIGQTTTVLSPDFLLAVESGGDYQSLLPFDGRVSFPPVCKF